MIELILLLYILFIIMVLTIAKAVGARTTLSFLWYDLWIGFYYSKDKKVLYFCPLPMVVFAFGSG
jgi:hypothetical protein